MALASVSVSSRLTGKPICWHFACLWRSTLSITALLEHSQCFLGQDEFLIFSLRSVSRNTVPGQFFPNTFPREQGMCWKICSVFDIIPLQVNIKKNTPAVQCTLTVLKSILSWQCTMRKLKNGVKSGQLWQIISPPIFNEISPNLEGWCKNIKKSKKLLISQISWKIDFLNRKKPVGGVVTR